MKVDLDYIKEHADSTVTPIVVTNLNDSKLNETFWNINTVKPMSISRPKIK